MARASVSFGILISIGGQQTLHAAGEIWTRRSEKQMEMIRHEDKRKQFPAAANDRIFQVVAQFLPIGIIPKDRLSRVSTRHHMVDSAGVLDSQWSGHESILSVFLALVNKKQGLTPDTGVRFGDAAD
jgi:hypothetical protein